MIEGVRLVAAFIRTTQATRGGQMPPLNSRLRPRLLAQRTGHGREHFVSMGLDLGLHYKRAFLRKRKLCFPICVGLG